MINPRRGELYWVDWSPGRGSEQMGRGPALVIQTDAGNTNPNYPNTIVACVSSKGRLVPTHVQIQPSKANGLREKSFVKCEQLLNVSKERLTARIGVIEQAALGEVDSSLRAALNLE